MTDSDSVQGAIQEAKEGEQAAQQAGYDQAALDETGRRGFENAEFEHSEDETAAVVEEFYPEFQSVTERKGSSTDAYQDIWPGTESIKQRLLNQPHSA